MYVQHASMSLFLYSPASHLCITFLSFGQGDLWASESPTACRLKRAGFSDTASHTCHNSQCIGCLFGVKAGGNACFFPCKSQTLSSVEAAMTGLNKIVQAGFSAAWTYVCSLKVYCSFEESPSLLDRIQHLTIYVTVCSRQADNEEIAATSVAAPFISSAFYFINWESKILVIACFQRICENNSALTKLPHKCFSFWMRHLKITFTVDLITVKSFHNLFQVIRAYKLGSSISAPPLSKSFLEQAIKKRSGL